MAAAGHRPPEGLAAGRGRAAVALVMTGIALALGCGPANLTMLLVPFIDTNMKPVCPLAESGKEVTVVIMVAFADREVPERPEVQPADHELAEKLAQRLRKRCQDNKEKVKVVSPTQVHSYLSKKGRLGVIEPEEVGKHFKADRVIAVEIARLSLFEPRTSPRMLRGSTDLTVSVYDLTKPEGERKVFEKPYRREYPKDHPLEANNGSETPFRVGFLMQVAGDLSRLFSPYDPDELRRME